MYYCIINNLDNGQNGSQRHPKQAGLEVQPYYSYVSA